jgi:hypothetical protein
MMRYGIPKYRLPRGIMDAEVNRILDMGVTLELNTKVTDILGEMAVHPRLFIHTEMWAGSSACCTTLLGHGRGHHPGGQRLDGAAETQPGHDLIPRRPHPIQADNAWTELLRPNPVMTSFLADCTPGCYNNEGHFAGQQFPLGSGYHQGASACFRYISECARRANSRAWNSAPSDPGPPARVWL